MRVITGDQWVSVVVYEPGADPYGPHVLDGPISDLTNRTGYLKAVLDTLTAPEGADVSVDTTNFDGNLSELDDTLQKALDTIDDLALAGGTASTVATSTTNFNGNLSSADNTVQKALDTLDNLVVPTGFAASAITLSTTNFNGNLSSADNTVQKAMETLDELSASAGVWVPLTADVDYESEPADVHELGMLTDLTGSVQPGYAIRLMCQTGYFINNTGAS